MNVVLPLSALARPLGPGWKSPTAALTLANGTVLTQMLESALKVTGARAILLCPPEALAAIEAAVDEAGLDATVHGIEADPPGGMVWTAREAWRDGSVLLLPGDCIIDVELAHLDDETVDVVLIAQPHELETHPDTQAPPRHFAGAAWFRSGQALEGALRAAAGSPLDLERDVVAALAAGRHGWREARLRLPLTEGETPSPALLLAANARLLSFGRSSAEAIERSYSEEFTVIPPVYIHEDAVVESSVIASQSTIAAGAVVRNSVLHRCLVGPGVVIDNAVLDGALIGANARVSGNLRPLLLPEGQSHVG